MNRRMRFFLVLPVCASALLQAQLNAPRVGTVRYLDKSVHIVYGVPASYIVDRTVLASADEVSFSDAGGLIAHNGHIVLVDGAFKTVAEYASEEAAPVLNIDGDLSTAVAWLPTRRALLRWDGTSFAMTEVNDSGALNAVTSVHLAGSKTSKLLVTNADGSVSEAVVSLASGEIISSQVLPGIRGPAFQEDSFIVFPDHDSLAIATRTAIVRTFPLDAPDLTIERASSGSLHVLSAHTGENWILHLGHTSATRLARLPALASATVIAPESNR